MTSAIAWLLLAVCTWQVHLAKSSSNITPENRTLCPETPESRPPNRVNTTEKLVELRQMMENATLDGYAIMMTDEHGSTGAGYDARVEYISGFAGSDGWAVVIEEKAALWTDSRYFLQADEQLDCNWILMKLGEPGYPSTEQWMVDVLSTGSRVGAYPNYVSSTTWQSYASALGTIDSDMVAVEEDLIDEMWTDPDRPAKSNEPLIVHTLNFTGKSWEDKLTDVRSSMTEANAYALVLTVLEQVAWLFNLRGKDLSDSLFYGYGIVFHQNASLYLRNYTYLIKDSLVRDHLQIDEDGSCRYPHNITCINVFEYDDITRDVESIASSTDQKIWIDPSANYAIYNAAGEFRAVSESPIEFMKAIKNEVERERFAECIIRDSAAVAEFAALIENEIEAGEHWTELSAAARLKQIRSNYEHNQGISFETISAFGDHSSVIHYTPTEETDARIDTSSVYLVDSGGQYLDGTTDSTRTFHYGTPADRIKEAYTRVLMGHIDLAQTVWPQGLTGSPIDVRARTPLWQHGWDFNHGTGHGIGYFLSVHEGPGSIGIGSSSSVLYEGMFFSNEPGYYEDNEFGIRLESLVTVEKADTPNDFGGKTYLGFKTLTLVPFEPKLIDYDMLSSFHKEWLDEYNRRCEEEVGKYLQDRNKEEAYEWLKARTSPDSDISRSSALVYSTRLVAITVSCLLMLFV